MKNAAQDTMAFLVAQVRLINFRDHEFYFTIYNVVACGCHTQGSSSAECDSSGKCSCKSNVINDKCTSCKSEYFGFPDCQGNYIKSAPKISMATILQFNLL